MAGKSIALVNYYIRDCNIYERHKNIKTDGILKQLNRKFQMDVGGIIFVMEKL